MKRRKQDRDVRDRWAQLRFTIVGPLLSSPPKRGQLGAELDRLAARLWTHPETGELVQFGRSTIERWYYEARASEDPLQELRRRIRGDRGQHPSLSAKLRQVLLDQSRAHPNWSYHLHAKNLAAVIRQQPEFGEEPSESTVRRFLQSCGRHRQRKRKSDTDGARRAAERFEQREVRSFEVEYVGALWHLDFHVCSRSIVMPEGKHRQPVLLGILDDHSRLACHVQWYLAETAENLVHGLSQAILKRGLPRALMTDNGSAMLAEETRNGLLELSISHELTLPYSAYQNAKQEVFWSSVEGRLMAMLEGEEQLTLELLNRATQAWLEADYQQRVHSELGTTPAARFFQSRSVLRESPSMDILRRAFQRQATRRQRRSDGTIQVGAVRFEVPSRYETLRVVTVRYAEWNLSSLDLIDERTGVVLARLVPLDRQRNARLRRKRRERGPTRQQEGKESSAAVSSGIAPWLRQMMEDRERWPGPPPYLFQKEVAPEDTSLEEPSDHEDTEITQDHNDEQENDS